LKKKAKEKKLKGRPIIGPQSDSDSRDRKHEEVKVINLFFMQNE